MCAMASDKKSRPSKPDFSIDDFIREIEKAEDAAASKPLPQERLRNKRRLDREVAAAANPPVEKKKTAKSPSPASPSGARTKTTGRSPVTGMSLKAPKSKANAIERPTNLDGFGKPRRPASAMCPPSPPRETSPALPPRTPKSSPSFAVPLRQQKAQMPVEGLAGVPG